MKICAHLQFAGQCHEAVYFYARVLGLKRPVLKMYGESSVDAEDTRPEAERVAFAYVEVDNSRIIFSDLPNAKQKRKAAAQSLTLVVKSEKKLEKILAQLAEGGRIDQVPQKEQWSKLAAMVTDKYGVQWQLLLDSKKLWQRERSDRW